MTHVNGETEVGALHDLAARRLSNQLVRSFRGTYGAETGLRTVVRSIANQMLMAGSSRDVVSRAIERRVLEYAATRPPRSRREPSTELHSQRLVELARREVAAAADEVAAAGRDD